MYSRRCVLALVTKSFPARLGSIPRSSERYHFSSKTLRGSLHYYRLVQPREHQLLSERRRHTIPVDQCLLQCSSLP